MAASSAARPMLSDVDDLEQIEEALSTVGEWLKQADVLIVADGERCELEEALEGQPWPGLQSVGLPLEQLRGPELFGLEPALAWAYWAHSWRTCRRLRPCPSQSLARDCAGLAPLSGVVLTASIDSRWVRAGWPQDHVLELRGSLRRLQCSAPCCDEVWDAPGDLGLEEDPETHHIEGQLPLCPLCGCVARPCVRMSQDDATWVGRRARHLPAQEAWLRRALARCSGSSAVYLELGGASGSASAAWEAAEELIVGQGVRRARVAMEPSPWSSDAEVSLGKGHCFWLPMRSLQVLQRWSAVLGTVEQAIFLILDLDNNGAEISMPSCMNVERLAWKACAEFHGNVTWDPGKDLEGVVCHIEDQRMQQRLGRHEGVPRQLFAELREDQPRVAVVRLLGPRFHGLNGRLFERIHSTRCMLLDMNTIFGSAVYRTKLGQIKHQMELRNMIKEVHLQMLPKYGFPLLADSDTGTTWRLQMKMQHSNTLSSLVDPDILNLVQTSLELSGMTFLASLPTIFQARAKKPEAVVRAPPPDSAPFRPPHPRLKLFFGGWFGEVRAPSVFVEAPSEAVVTYLRDDPDGPFSTRVDAWPDTQEPPEASRWHRWGFQRDSKEFILKADWHAVPRLGPTADLFVPRLGKKGTLKRAPKRYLAFAEAFRVANQPCWNAMVKALQDLKRSREDQVLKASLAAIEAGECPPMERSGADLIASIIRALVAQRHFGVFEAQVWWGEKPRKLPSHKDGATSLLHLGITLSGKRTVRLGAFYASDAEGPEGRWWEASSGKEDVWDELPWYALGAQEQLRDIEMTRGSAYLSSPYVFEHGVNYLQGTWEEPVIALQCRLAFDAEPGKELNGLRDGVMRDVSAAVAQALTKFSATGDLRMPALEEVLEAEARVPSIWAEKPAAGG